MTISLSGPLGQTDDPIRIITSADYLFHIDDAGGWLRFDNGDAITATMPDTSEFMFLPCTSITIEQTGAGQVTVVADEGVTINSPATLKTNQQHSIAVLTLVAANTWNFAGDIAAS
jgi:hypothetical protein